MVYSRYSEFNRFAVVRFFKLLIFILKQILPFLYYGLPEQLLPSSVAINIQQFADWFSLLHRKSFTEADLTLLDELGQKYVTPRPVYFLARRSFSYLLLLIVSRWQCNTLETFAGVSQFRILKFHMLGHVSAAIRKFGNPVNFSTASWEVKIALMTYLFDQNKFMVPVLHVGVSQVDKRNGEEYNP